MRSGGNTAAAAQECESSGKLCPQLWVTQVPSFSPVQQVIPTKEPTAQTVVGPDIPSPTLRHAVSQKRL